jgi:hypothetical protein
MKEVQKPVFVIPNFSNSRNYSVKNLGLLWLVSIGKDLSAKEIYASEVFIGNSATHPAMERRLIITPEISID